MRIAIIAITENGQKLAREIAENLRHDPTILEVELFKMNAKKELNTIFGEYDCIIGIMAIGIMIRSICDPIKNKIDDPAILVVDELGKHVISLLSGHYRGANQLAVKVGGIIGGDPVVTTATDLHGIMGIDCLARIYKLKIPDPENIKFINSALLKGSRVELAVPSGFDFLFDDPLVRKFYKHRSSATDKLEASINNIKLVLIPRKLVVGVGTKKGVSSNEIIDLIECVMEILKLPLERIDALATGRMKKDEMGLKEASDKLGVPIETVPIDTLKSFRNIQISESKLVRDKFGISGVCEPSALIAAGDDSRLIFKKTTKHGVALAIAVSSD